MEVRYLVHVLFYVGLLLTGIIQNVKASNRTYAQQLINDLLNGYDTAVRPTFGERMNISVGFYFFSIKDFDEKSGTLTSVGGPFYFWEDSRLAWNGWDYGHLYTLPIPSNKIWYPDLYLINPADKMEPIGDSSFFPRLIFNGIVWRYIASIMKTSCDVDMTYFPFDTQVCQIEISAWGYGADELYLTNMDTTVDLTYFKENSQWRVEKTVLREHSLQDAKGMVAAEISLKRKPEYFAVNIIAPIFMLCILNPLVFLLPTESGERISYTITIFLSLAVFMTLISDNMPKSSEPMSRLSYILLGTMGYSTALCVISIFILRIHFRKPSEPIPTWMRKTTAILQCRCLCSCRKRKQKPKASSTTKVVNISEKPKIAYTDDNVDDDDDIDKEMTWKEFSSVLDSISFIYSCIFLAGLVVATFTSLLV